MISSTSATQLTLAGQASGRRDDAPLGRSRDRRTVPGCGYCGARHASGDCRLVLPKRGCSPAVPSPAQDRAEARRAVQAAHAVRVLHAPRLAALRSAHDLTGEQAAELADVERAVRDAAWRAALANLGLVRRYVSCVAAWLAGRTSHTADDLLHEGLVGLARALETFEPSDGAFSTYAWYWIRQHIQRALTGSGLLVRVPAHVSEMRRRVERVAESRASEKDTRMVGAARRRTLDAAGAMWSGWLGDQRPDEEAPADPLRRRASASDAVDGYSEHARRTACPDRACAGLDAARLRRAVAALPAREGRVLAARWGLDGLGERTLDQVAAELAPPGKRPVSREAVRQVEARGLRRLRRLLGVGDARAPHRHTAGL